MLLDSQDIKGAECSLCSGTQHRVGGSFCSALSVEDKARNMASLLLLLFTFGALLSSSNSQENNYNKLSESYKKGVDLALQKLHSHTGIQHHFVFLRSLLKSDIQVAHSLFSITACLWGLTKAFYLNNVLFLSARFRCDLHIPPLLPQTHNLPKRNSWLRRLSAPKKQSEFSQN